MRARKRERPVDINKLIKDLREEEAKLSRDIESLAFACQALAPVDGAEGLGRELERLYRRKRTERLSVRGALADMLADAS